MGFRAVWRVGALAVVIALMAGCSNDNPVTQMKSEAQGALDGLSGLVDELPDNFDAVDTVTGGDASEDDLPDFLKPDEPLSPADVTPLDQGIAKPACLALVQMVGWQSILIPSGGEPSAEAVEEKYSNVQNFHQYYPPEVQQAIDVWSSQAGTLIDADVDTLVGVVTTPKVSEATKTLHRYGPALCPAEWEEAHL